MGVRIGQNRISSLLGDHPEGADETDILLAISTLGGQVDELDTGCRKEAQAWLSSRAPMFPLILCVDNWKHWVVIGGYCGSRYNLQDSGKSPWNLAENGQWAITEKRLLKRWRASRSNRTFGGLYYGIAVLSINKQQARGRPKRRPHD